MKKLSNFNIYFCGILGGSLLFSTSIQQKAYAHHCGPFDYTGNCLHGGSSAGSDILPVPTNQPDPLASTHVLNPKYYLEKYPDLRKAFGSNNYSAAIDHWVRHGAAEGRQGSPDFDSRFYLSNNPDVAKAYGADNYRGAVEHYLKYGRAEGREGVELYPLSPLK